MIELTIDPSLSSYSDNLGDRKDGAVRRVNKNFGIASE